MLSLYTANAIDREYDDAHNDANGGTLAMMSDRPHSCGLHLAIFFFRKKERVL